MRTALCFASWVCLIIASVCSAAEKPHAKFANAPITRDRSSLDTASTLLLIRPQSGGVVLRWLAQPDLSLWAVTASFFADMADADTLAITSDTFFVDAPLALTRRFYRVDGVDSPPPPDTTVVIENFETGAPSLFSITGEDDDPSDWQRITSDFYANGHALRIFGDTWKREPVTVARLDTHSVWQVAMKLVARSELMAFGIADSANTMYYVIWGTEAPQSQQWITVYEGWFDTLEWVPLRLPVGEDWLGRFGYLPRILEIRYVNDNDNTNPPGEVRFDEILDISGALSDPPVANFEFVIEGQTADSLRVQFCTRSYDLDSPPVDHLWDFGTGQTASALSPEYTFAAHSKHTVTLTVTDDSGNVDWKSLAVIDSPFTQTRELTFAFAGDVMIGRGYDNNGGIIDTWGVDTIFTPTRHLLASMDLASVNLECVLTNAVVHHPTKAIYFKGQPSSVSGLANAGIDFANLANNHILDYMAAGMLETQSLLDSVGIAHSGAGMNDLLARRAKFISRNGISLAMLGFSDRTGSYNNYQPFLDAGRSRPGFAMWNRTAIESTVPEASALADFVVLNIHAGDEYSLAPSLQRGDWDDVETVDGNAGLFELIPDTLQRQVRRYAIDQGADLVICHHPHVLQGFEVYNGKLIAHSLGDYIFDINYPETMPSVVLQTHFSEGVGVDRAIVHPVYIDHWIPRPATGELGRAILDYESNMSRQLSTWLVRIPGDDSARIVFDTTLAVRSGVDYTDTLALFTSGAWMMSHPLKMRGDGYAVSIGVVAPDSCEVRYGRDKLWFGNMESEGANGWQLNSGDEAYNTVEFHGGLRSIRLRRAPGPQNVVTNIEYRAPMKQAQDYSVVGWVKTQDAIDAQYQIQFWNGRSGGTMLAQFNVNPLLSGTNNWTQVSASFNSPDGTSFYLLRASLSPPNNGTAFAWFDDVAVVEWESWQAAPAVVPFPGDYTYLQVRTASGSTAVVDCRREWVE